MCVLYSFFFRCQRPTAVIDPSLSAPTPSGSIPCTVLTGDQLPSIYRHLLYHPANATPHLATFYGSPMRLEVLQSSAPACVKSSNHDKSTPSAASSAASAALSAPFAPLPRILTRMITLRTDPHAFVSELAFIHIHLDALPAGVQERAFSTRCTSNVLASSSLIHTHQCGFVFQRISKFDRNMFGRAPARYHSARGRRSADHRYARLFPTRFPDRQHRQCCQVGAGRISHSQLAYRCREHASNAATSLCRHAAFKCRRRIGRDRCGSPVWPL